MIYELTDRISSLQVALHLVMTTKHDAVERFREPDSDGRYTLELYGGKRADGGYLVTTWGRSSSKPTAATPAMCCNP